MSESNDDNANGTQGQGSQPALPHHESPSMVPDEKAHEPAAKPVDPSEISVPSRAIEPASRAARGTVLLLTLPRPEDATAGAAPEPKKTRRLLNPAALSMIAVLIGAAVGSAATAALLYTGGTPAAAPSDPMTFTAALERIDHELTNLKTSIEGSAKQSNAQVAKITDRLDRADKTQTDTAAKIARTGESLDRIDHRLTGSTSGEATGAVPSASLAPGPGRAGTYGAPILEGWVLRDIFNGGAMLQSPRNGILEVIPGENVPGLGRIDSIRRQDGRWVVVTSRGLIVAR
jgi:hypothetical protein